MVGLAVLLRSEHDIGKAVMYARLNYDVFLIIQHRYNFALSSWDLPIVSNL